MSIRNGQTEEALIIRSKMTAEGYTFYGLPELKKHEQILLLNYLQKNSFDAKEMEGIAKLFECRLFKKPEEAQVVLVLHEDL